MRLSHGVPVRSAVFDEPNLVSHAGLVPAMGLAARAGLIELADRHLTVSGGPGHAAGLKVSALVGGMALFLIATLVFHAMQEGATTTGVVSGHFCAAAASCLLLLGVLGARIPPWMAPAVYLGKISYGLYVFHVLCLDLTNRWMGVAGQPAYLLLKIFVALGSTCVLAALSYRFIESPFIRLKERFAVIQSRSV